MERVPPAPKIGGAWKLELSELGGENKTQSECGTRS